VHETETNCEQVVAKLELRLDGVEADRQALSVRLATVEATFKSSVEKLQNDRIKLEVGLGQKEAEIALLTKRLGCGKEENVSAIENDTLRTCLEEQVDSLTKLYSSVRERNEKLGSSVAGLVECEHFLTRDLVPEVRRWDTDCKEKILSKVNEFCESNRAVFSGEWLVEHENANGEVVALNKKLKLQMNYLASLLFDNSDSYEFEQLKKFDQNHNNNNNKPFSSTIVELFSSLLSEDSSPSSSFQLNQRFSTGLKQIHETLEKILRILNEKLSVEYTLNYPVGVTMTDECIVSYLTEFRQSLTRLQGLMSTETGVVELCRNLPSARQVRHEGKKEKEKIAKLQKDVDDYERLQFRFEQVCKELEQLRTLEKEQRELISKLEAREEYGPDEAMKVELYVRKISRLDEQVQELDGKAIFYYEEMKCMVERLRLEVEARGLLEGELSEVRDQLERTRSSYEMQMSTMSDHLIEITDKMSRQEADNERLRHELASAVAVGNGKGGKAKKTK